MGTLLTGSKEVQVFYEGKKHGIQITNAKQTETLSRARRVGFRRRERGARATPAITHPGSSAFRNATSGVVLRSVGARGASDTAPCVRGMAL